MPKELKNITTSVMDQINQGRLKMRPKFYFVLGSVLSLGGLVASIVISVFSVSLTRFILRARGPMSGYRLEQILSDFPWWLPVLAILGLVGGAWFLRRYDFSYKKNFWLIALGFVVAIVLAGWLINAIGLDDMWLRRGPMQGMMRHYIR